MITIAEEHYQRLLELVRSMSKTLRLQHPASDELAALCAEWSSICDSLRGLYKRVEVSLEDILSRNRELSN
jgi:hypothetical protein